SLSTHTTSLPFSARQAPATRPTYPLPTTAILIRDGSPLNPEPHKLAQPKKRCQSVDVQGFVRFPRVLGSPGVRILLDYRPALVQRTGVGEYAPFLAAALVSELGPSDTLTLFSSSWKDRLDQGRLPGASVVDARVPVHFLNFAWHRLAWPPVETLAG